jgi:hypothetical protein
LELRLLLTLAPWLHLQYAEAVCVEKANGMPMTQNEYSQCQSDRFYRSFS